MMKNWIFSTQPANFVIIGVTSFFLLCGPTASAEQNICAIQDSAYVHPTTPPVVVSDELGDSVRFKKLAAEWRSERGATSSIEDMCTRPAYLKILAMGPAAVPLLIRELRSEGDDPDHWFVALHYITKGADPVPDEDKGDLVKMAQAWLKWADEGNAG